MHACASVTFQTLEHGWNCSVTLAATLGDRDRTAEIREECVKATRAGELYSVLFIFSWPKTIVFKHETFQFLNEASGLTYKVKCKWQKNEKDGLGAFEIVFSHKVKPWT